MKRDQTDLRKYNYAIECPGCGHLETPDIFANNDSVVWVEGTSGSPSFVQKRCKLCGCVWRERTFHDHVKRIRYAAGVGAVIFLALVVGSCILVALILGA